MRARVARALTQSGSSAEPKQSCNKRDLPNDIALGQPPHLSLADHVQHLDALDRSRRTRKRPEALTRPHSSFDGAVILLHDVVQVPNGAASAAPPEVASLLQPGDDLRIRRVAIHIDHPWTRMPRRLQSLLP